MQDFKEVLAVPLWSGEPGDFDLFQQQCQEWQLSKEIWQHRMKEEQNQEAAEMEEARRKRKDQPKR